ncbi:hypothetical protein EV182_003252 [Spiromyces aspiralis]|uniref:Uncharacterized protein n=1 Tax=Spiromyces aspiralis TaxID=68401 RepID=A0ACC1HS36_9FUNG|nr:hypothetical protein EV182_003252 [Spiromyces aspiralis]
MTTEIRTTSRPIPTTTAPPTSSYSVRSSASILASPARPPPTFASIKGVAYSMAPPSGGPRRRTLATSLIASGSTPKVKHFPQSPAGLMRSVLTIQHRQASATSHEQRPTTSPAPNAKAASSPLQISSFHQGPALSLPGSAASRMSKATSSVGTEDLMMDSSPLHTVTMAFPKSHKKSQLTLPSTHRGQVYPNSGGDSGPRNINSTSHHSGNDDNANDNDDDDVDDILSEVDSLINRYQSPGAKGNIAVSRMGVSRVSDSALSRRSHVSQSSSQGPGEKEIEEMTALVGKYISPEHHRYYLGGHVPAAASASKSKNNGAPHVTNGLKNRLVSEMDEVIGKGSSIVNADPGDSLAFSAKPNDGSGGDDSDIDLDTEIEPPALTVSLESLNRPRSIKRLPTEQQQQQQPQHQLLVAAVSKGGNVDGGSGNSGNSVSGAARSASNVLIERPQKRHQHRGGDETICMDVEDMDDVTISRQSPLAMQAHRAQARQEAVLRQQIKSSSAGGQRQAQRPAQNRTSTATNLRSAGGQSQITPHFASAGLYDPNDDPFFPPQASSVSSSHARLETTSRNADSSAITADTSQITSDQAPTNPRWQRHGYLIDEDESMDLNPASIAKNDNIPPTSVSANSFSGSDGRR